MLLSSIRVQRVAGTLENTMNSYTHTQSLPEDSRAGEKVAVEERQRVTKWQEGLAG